MTPMLMAYGQRWSQTAAEGKSIQLHAWSDVPRAKSRAREVPVAVPDAINKRILGNGSNIAERRSFEVAILVPLC